MAAFELNLEIDKQILDSQSTDKLMIARKVNGHLNTIFDGYSIIPDRQWQQLLPSNSFKWTERFRVFLVHYATSGVPIRHA